MRIVDTTAFGGHSARNPFSTYSVGVEQRTQADWGVGRTQPLIYPNWTQSPSANVTVTEYETDEDVEDVYVGFTVLKVAFTP